MSNTLGVCPDCGTQIRFKKPPVLGQVTTCRSCEAQLEVVERSPLVLDWTSNDQLYADNSHMERKRSRTDSKSKNRQEYL